MDTFPNRVEDLQDVLADAEHPRARYHIRQALQYAVFSESGELPSTDQNG